MNTQKVYFAIENVGTAIQQVLAVFYEMDHYYFPSQRKVCYSHIGQHSSCTLAYITEQTIPATPKQYISLKCELEQDYGYNLDIQEELPEHLLLQCL